MQQVSKTPDTKQGGTHVVEPCILFEICAIIPEYERTAISIKTFTRVCNIGDKTTVDKHKHLVALRIKSKLPVRAAEQNKTIPVQNFRLTISKFSYIPQLFIPKMNKSKSNILIIPDHHQIIPIISQNTKP